MGEIKWVKILLLAGKKWIEHVAGSQVGSFEGDVFDAACREWPSSVSFKGELPLHRLIQKNGIWLTQGQQLKAFMLQPVVGGL